MNRTGKKIVDRAWFIDRLQCPNCFCALKQDDGVSCPNCAFLEQPGRDLRLGAARQLSLHIANLPVVDPTELLRTIDTSIPGITYLGPKASRDSRELMSEISRRLPDGGTVLDLGCGPRDQAASLEFLGFKYVGVDHGDEQADFLADAHALPLRDASFDCVFSYAVLEHLHNPFLAIQEVSRVLKPGGWLVGTVSQGEPFHNSYFHHTPWGLVSLVGSVPGLKIQRMWPSHDTLAALASMGRYSRLIRWALAVLDHANDKLPWLTPRKMRWPRKDQDLDRLFRAGGICFAIRKQFPQEQGR